MPRVALVGTLDTKGSEYGWVARQLMDLGAEVTVMHTGSGDAKGYPGDIDVANADVAAAAGHSLTELTT